MITEATQVSAVSGSPEWRGVNWRKVNGIVRRLQARIVKATQAKR